jgi:hypothetical protein
MPHQGVLRLCRGESGPASCQTLLYFRRGRRVHGHVARQPAANVCHIVASPFKKAPRWRDARACSDAPLVFQQAVVHIIPVAVGEEEALAQRAFECEAEGEQERLRGSFAPLTTASMRWNSVLANA